MTSTRQDEPSLGALVHDLSEEIPDLIRAEMRLAQAEVTAKGKRLGLGVGLFGSAGVLALFAFGCALAAAILGLAVVLPGWAAALIIAGALLLLAGAVAVFGKQTVDEATPPIPERAVSGVQQDVETLKGVRP